MSDTRRPGTASAWQVLAWGRRVWVLPIRFYQRFVSPLLPRCCRFVPTCSEYAVQAVEAHGILKGSALAVWRIMRCNPWCRGGYDPVPSPRGRGKASGREPEGPDDDHNSASEMGLQ